MDLVSNTLDKYLRHRFNKVATSNTIVPKSATSTSINNLERSPNLDENPSQVGDDALDEATSDNPHCSVDIQSVSFHKMMPCCVTIRDDLAFIAAGFENSQIYVWTILQNLESNNHSQQHQSHDLIGESSSTAETLAVSSGSGSSNNENNCNKTLKLGTVSRLTAHSGSVYSIQFLSDNNDLMLSCSEDTTIRLWCLKTKCNLFVYRGHNYPVWSISVASSNNYFASASMDTTARLWQLDNMCPIRVFCGHDSDVECVKFHPNAKYLATGSSDSTVRLWNISDGRMVRLMVGHKCSITSLSFLPDGKFLASASSDGNVKIWNLASNTVENDLLVPTTYKISFSQQQKFISTCGTDNIIRLWKIGKSEIFERKQVDFSDKFSGLVEPQFHRDNKLFVIGFSKESANRDGGR